MHPSTLTARRAPHRQRLVSRIGRGVALAAVATLSLVAPTLSAAQGSLDALARSLGTSSPGPSSPSTSSPGPSSPSTSYPPPGPLAWTDGQSCAGFESFACGAGTTYRFASAASVAAGRRAEPTCSGATVESPRVMRPMQVAPNPPCAVGTCLGDDPLKPWVAVVDWRDDHGYSVAAMIEQASSGRLDTRLFALDQSRLQVLSQAPVSDAHVLEQLCAVLERVEAGDRPAAVNLSFGRFEDPLVATDCSAPSIGCAVRDTLDALAAHRIPIFAAAGNHGEERFPASHGAVFSIGAVDPLAFTRTRVAAPSVHAPSTADVVLPAQGLWLDDATALASAAHWPVPPGTSYAAAMASGWLGAAIVDRPALLDELTVGPHPVEPYEISGPLQRIALRSKTQQLAGTTNLAAGELIYAAAGERPTVCHRAASPHQLTLTVAGLASGLPSVSLDQILAGLNRPSPDSEPCYPCHGTFAGASKIESRELAMSRVPTAEARSLPVEIDTSRSQGVPPGARLVGVYLRSGVEVYRFDESYDPDVIASITAADHETLQIIGPSHLWEKETALVLVLTLEDSAGIEVQVCSAAPMTFHAH